MGESPLFTFLSDSNATVEIAQGDARLSLEREGPGLFDVIAVDAFSSDSIPTHLLTVEAMAVYERHLRDRQGIVALHVSNRYLDLAPVVSALALDMGWSAVGIDSERDDTMVWKSDWILLCRDAEVLAVPPFSVFGKKPEKALRVPWTDSRSDIVSLLRW